MKKQTRMYAWLLCIGFVLTLFVSSAYVVQEIGHDCTGDECAVCEVIAQTEALLHGFALLGVALLLLLSALTSQKSHRLLDAIRLPEHRTLVSWKVRLND